VFYTFEYVYFGFKRLVSCEYEDLKQVSESSVSVRHIYDSGTCSLCAMKTHVGEMKASILGAARTTFSASV
jgi:hypothetical protein